MNQLLNRDVKKAQRILREYEEVLDTVEPHYKLFSPYSYVPNIFDVVGACDGTAEDAFFNIYRVYTDHHIFYKHDGKYYNKPLKEVW